MAAHLIPATSTTVNPDDSRWERIDGQWRERPVPTSLHTRVQSRIHLLLAKAIEGIEAEVGTEWSIDQPEHAHRDDPNYMTADVLVVVPPTTDAQTGHLATGGFLAVEVLSPGQTLFDKAARYFAWGIPHIWIINPDTRECLEYHGGWQFTAERETLHAGPITLPVASIFEGLKR